MTINPDIVTLTYAEQGLIWLRTNITDIAGGIAVLVIGLFIGSVIARWVLRGLSNSSSMDISIARIIAKVVKYAIWAVVFLTVLAQFGVETTSIIAALGGAALAVGLALQGTLSNVASGVMIMTQRPFRVGEAIMVGGITAQVEEIGLFTTKLKQFDGLFVMMPNNEIWNQPITNYTRNPVRRFELVVGIGYDDSMKEARDALLALAHADERVLDDPEPAAFVASLDDSSVGIGLRVWCKTDDYLALSWDLTEAAKATFDEKGISIPFPQRVVTTMAA
ncbi:mechanosensitive ion channel [Erythrobacter sp. SCSIO 43205]|uniref:mechanosensitive ion channel family protein n=1 Tax=Erythrobacter sp. SCSIO 43205 TaxID=2779361 RepID=UPI001CA9F943|nr:mechanosensitive ion channel domain-containing protein [Erythrobacter sp. SCSIO 43205]UAB78262.1 mechanosensitive ion channel [Erythrobacter sp. SCSIO 43205]